MNGDKGTLKEVVNHQAARKGWGAFTFLSVNFVLLYFFFCSQQIKPIQTHLTESKNGDVFLLLIRISLIWTDRNGKKDPR